MCIGVPMEVIEAHDYFAICRTAQGQQARIDTMLLGQVGVGSWLLTFLDTAREVISEEQAKEINSALQGLQAAINGDDFSHLFADLIEQEPELPAFLRDMETAKDTSK